MHLLVQNENYIKVLTRKRAGDAHLFYAVYGNCNIVGCYSYNHVICEARSAAALITLSTYA